MTGLAVAGWSRLRWDADVLNTLPLEEPSVRGLQLHQQHFAAADELILRLRADTEEEVVDAARALAWHLRQQTSLVATAWWQPPWEEEPGALAALVGEVWLNAPPNEVERLRQELAPESVRATFNAARERLGTSLTPSELARLSHDPLGLTRLLEGAVSLMEEGPAGALGFQSADGCTRFIWVKSRLPLKSYRDCRDWMQEVQLVINRWQCSNGLPPGLGIGFTGRPAFMAEIGGGMERDLSGPALGTLALIGALFYFVHRRWRPLLWLVALLALNFALTLGLGVWLLGAINVVNLGFAAILLGLAADYAIVLLQELRTHPGVSIEEIQRRARAGIYWSAVTTAGAFLLLNFSALPGLGQLGTLVALGILLAAAMMTHLYLLPLRGVWSGGDSAAAALVAPATANAAPAARRRLWLTMGLGMAAMAVLLVGGLPALQKSTDSLRPKRSEAYAVWDEFKQATGAAQEPLLVVMRSKETRWLYEAALELRQQGEALAGQGLIHGISLPVELAAAAPWRNVNQGNLKEVVARREGLMEAAREAGITTNALRLTLQVFEHWAQAAGPTPPALSDAAQWLRERCYAHDGRQHLLLGVVYPAEGTTPALLNFRPPALRPVEVHVTNWEWVGRRMAQTTLRELPWLLAAMGGLVAGALWLAFRSGREVGLSLAVLLFSLLLLVAWMRLVGWSWNLMNLMALPLILGLGVDYCLHLLLGLRRHQGDWHATHQSVGKALLLAGATTAAAFGSLSLSSNAGVASLGKVTAAGVIACLVAALALLPAWESQSRR